MEDPAFDLPDGFKMIELGPLSDNWKEAEGRS
ncbi:hypothetical protein ES703_19130 [subsurface metagenome]